MPLPNPSANPVGKRRDFMKKITSCILALFLLLNICTNAVIAKEMTESDKDLYKNQLSAIEVFNQNNKSIAISDNDIYLMAQVVFAESRSEPYEGKVAVASVILNRAKSPGFPKTIQGVIKQKNAFSCVKNGSITIVPDESSTNAVIDALKGSDPTNSSLFFYNPRIATSKWMKNIQKSNVKEIGNHTFFLVKK